MCTRHSFSSFFPAPVYKAAMHCSYTLKLGLRIAWCLAPHHASAYVCVAHAGRPWSSRTTTVESNMKSEHNLHLACEDSPQPGFFFCTFSCSRLALLDSTVHWLHCFLFLNAANRLLRSVLEPAKRVCCGGPTALSYSSSIVKKRHSSLSSIARLGIRYFPVSVHVTYEFHDVWVPWRMNYVGIRYSPVSVHVTYEFLCVSANWHSWAWQTRTYVRTYIARIDPSIKASRQSARQ